MSHAGIMLTSFIPNDALHFLSFACLLFIFPARDSSDLFKNKDALDHIWMMIGFAHFHYSDKEMRRHALTLLCKTGDQSYQTMKSMEQQVIADSSFSK
jgi:hypothetical protein